MNSKKTGPHEMAIISGNYSPFHKSSKKSSTPPKEMALMSVYVL
jgi:hypothetical protein